MTKAISRTSDFLGNDCHVGTVPGLNSKVLRRLAFPVSPSSTARLQRFHFPSTSSVSLIMANFSIHILYTLIERTFPSLQQTTERCVRGPFSVISSLSSNLRVYEDVLPGDDSFHVEEQDCIPEVMIDEELEGCGEVAQYYGHGQFHVVGMLDMHEAGAVPYRWLASPAALQCRLASFLLGYEGLGGGGMAGTSPAGSWFLQQTKRGPQKIAHVNSDIQEFEGIATASITLNWVVPMQGIDPDRTFPYIRLAAAGIESGPITAVLADCGTRVAEQAGHRGEVSAMPLYSVQTISAMQHAMGVTSQRYVDHALALGESDPDLKRDDMVGGQNAEFGILPSS